MWSRPAFFGSVAGPCRRPTFPRPKIPSSWAWQGNHRPPHSHQGFGCPGGGKFCPFKTDTPIFQEAWAQLMDKIEQEELWLLSPSWEPAPEPPDPTVPGTWQWEFPLALSLDHWQDLLRYEAGDGGTAPALAKLILTPDGEAYVGDEGGNYYPWKLQLKLPLPNAEGLPLYRQPELEGFAFAPGIYVPVEELLLPPWRRRWKPCRQRRWPAPFSSTCPWSARLRSGMRR